ncbi:MAG: hypothetical protein KJO22_02175, partial [Bacteroidia bacterium]|nr:hypothetical protein [Bacteroidia bacterium]
METPYNNPFAFQDEESVDIKREINRYLRYWPWFVIALIATILSAYFYLRYAPRIFESTAKIKILDESEGLELPTSAFIFNRSNINLENETQILTSYIILEQVVKDLQLNTSFYEVGTIQTTQRVALPVDYLQLVAADSIEDSSSYTLDILNDQFVVTNNSTEEAISFPGHTTYTKTHDLPFQLQINDTSDFETYKGKRYTINFKPLKDAVLGLKQSVAIETVGDRSDILQMSLKGESYVRSESILNKLLEIFNQDGIKDRQLVSQRTIDFIDDRFEYLAQELDSIELAREDFKQDNNLVDLSADAELGLQQRTQSDQEVFRLENQLALANLLNNALKADDDTGLLPANFGLENSGINTLVEEYNAAILNRDKLISSGGRNNPS